MKKILIYTALGFSAWNFSACGSSDEDTSSLTDEVPQEEIVSEETVKNKYNDKNAILALRASIWTEAGTKDNGAVWIETLPYGAQVSLLGDTATVEKNLYVKVKASTGKEGWIRDRWLVIDGKVGVAISEIATYSSPDIMSLNKDKKIEFGTIFIVKERPEDDKYDKFITEGLKQEGYFKKGNEVSFSDIDLEVAILRNAALTEKSPEKKRAAIQEILDNLDYMSSPLYKDLETDEIMTEETEVPDVFMEHEEELF